MALNVLEHAILSVHVGLTDLSRRCTLLTDIVFGRVRPGPIRFPGGAFPHRSGCGELSDPDQRTPSQDDYQGMGNSLQPRQASLLTRPWITGTHPGPRSGRAATDTNCTPVTVL